MDPLDNIIRLFSEMNVTLIKEVNFEGDERLIIFKKDRLLDELMNVFLPFKRQGDRKLIPYETHCSSDVCSHADRSRLFCFVGNQTENYCLVKFILNDGVPIEISFCEAIQEPKGIDLNTLIEPPSRFGDDDLPF